MAHVLNIVFFQVFRIKHSGGFINSAWPFWGIMHYGIKCFNIIRYFDIVETSSDVICQKVAWKPFPILLCSDPSALLPTNLTTWNNKNCYRRKSYYESLWRFPLLVYLAQIWNDPNKVERKLQKYWYQEVGLVNQWQMIYLLFRSSYWRYLKTTCGTPIRYLWCWCWRNFDWAKVRWGRRPVESHKGDMGWTHC